MLAPIPTDEQERLDKLRHFEILDTLPEQVYDDLTRLAAHLFQAPIALVSLIDADRQWFKSRVGLDATETPRDVSFCGHAVVRPDEILLVPDATRDPRFHDNPLVLGGPAIRFYAGAPLVIGSGSAVGTLCVIDDKPRQPDPVQLDHLRALCRLVVSQLELRVMIKAAQQASEAKSLFFAGASHELRTPLNSIIGFTGILRKQAASKLDGRGQDYLERIDRNGRQLLELIDDILDLSKAEAGRIEVAAVPIQLRPVLEEVVKHLEAQARDRGTALDLAVPTGEHVVIGDVVRLRQVLVNLVANAIKFTENGRITLRVVCAAQDQVAAIEVEDTGIGIDATRTETIFEPFRQVDVATNQRYGGTGLGLSISRKLCQAMGFRLTVASEPGRGSTFRIEL